MLITGANGFIGSWITRVFLEKGYSVRAAIRSADKGVFLTKAHGSYGARFELIVVGDITKPGAFDEVVVAVDAIRVYYIVLTGNIELIVPAVSGIEGLLKSIMKNGESGSAAPVHLMYEAYKTLQEKAAWNFYNDNKANVQWDLVTLIPPYLMTRPVIHDVSEPATLNTSMLDWYYTVTAGAMGGKSVETVAKMSFNWLHVRDLAEAHSLALEKEAAGGQRIIVVFEPFVWQDWLDTANSFNPSPIPSHVLPKGHPGAGQKAVHSLVFDTSEADEILGMKYPNKE
ncbi:D-lactaldehyde dehydrogenase [Mycena floridula]|nr:D-lactaldehyde dehydrogenase [Mycena floridula]